MLVKMLIPCRCAGDSDSLGSNMTQRSKCFICNTEWSVLTSETWWRQDPGIRLGPRHSGLTGAGENLLI